MKHWGHYGQPTKSNGVGLSLRPAIQCVILVILGCPILYSIHICTEICTSLMYNPLQVGSFYQQFSGEFLDAVASLVVTV